MKLFSSKERITKNMKESKNFIAFDDIIPTPTKQKLINPSKNYIKNLKLLRALHLEIERGLTDISPIFTEEELNKKTKEALLSYEVYKVKMKYKHLPEEMLLKKIQNKIQNKNKILHRQKFKDIVLENYKEKEGTLKNIDKLEGFKNEED